MSKMKYAGAATCEVVEKVGDNSYTCDCPATGWADVLGYLCSEHHTLALIAGQKPVKLEKEPESLAAMRGANQ